MPPVHREAARARGGAAAPGAAGAGRKREPPATDPDTLYDLLPADHRMSYDMHQLLAAVLDGGRIDEFQQDLAREMICGDARIEGIPVGVIANQRGLIKGRTGERPRFGGIVYAESAEKVAYFIDRCNRQRIPILFVQDVSGFMVGSDAEHEGIIRAGARFVEAMATARVPKIVLTVNHASGAGYYAMAGQGFDPDFIFSWPTGRMAVMEGEAAVQAVHGPAIEAARAAGKEPAAEVSDSMEEMRADYEHQLDAKYAGARGYIDAIVYPEDTRTLSPSRCARRLRTRVRISGRSSSPHTSTNHERHRPRRIGTGILGRLARSPPPPGGGRPRGLPDARLPGRGHDVHSAEAEGTRPEDGIRPRLHRGDGERAARGRRSGGARHRQCRRRESAGVRRSRPGAGRQSRRARQTQGRRDHRRRPAAARWIRSSPPATRSPTWRRGSR